MFLATGSVRSNIDASYIDSITVGIKLDQRVTSLDANALHPAAEVLKLEVRACIRTLKLLIVVLKVDSFVVV